MSWSVLILASVGCYAMKAVGSLVPLRWVESPRIRRVAPLLPVALIVGLVVIQTFGDGRRLTVDARLPGMIAASIAIRVRAPFVIVVLVGAAMTALVRALS